MGAVDSDFQRRFDQIDRYVYRYFIGAKPGSRKAQPLEAAFQATASKHQRLASMLTYILVTSFKEEKVNLGADREAVTLGYTKTWLNRHPESGVPSAWDYGLA